MTAICSVQVLMLCPTIVGSVVGSDPSLLGGGQAAELE